MCREYEAGAFGNFVGFVDEYGAAFGEGVDHMAVMHNLLAHIDRSTIVLECALDGDHCAVNTGTVSARGGQKHLLVGAFRRPNVFRSEAFARNGGHGYRYGSHKHSLGRGPEQRLQR
ncbi:hypothetical protein BAU01nite_18130 [Brevibacterium aurantiacum]|nr:hypothetical protein BAU01nite_18130 [Brevibacterium aurantiacum]